MKRIIALIFALLIFSIPVFAENESKSEVTLTYTEGITLYGDGDEVFGIEKESFSKYIKENNIVLYGIANDKSFVFEMTCNQTEFSKSIKDFKNIKLMDIKDFAWDVFNKSGSIEAYLLYKAELEFSEKAGMSGVCEYTGCNNQGSEGGGER